MINAAVLLNSPGISSVPQSADRCAGIGQDLLPVAWIDGIGVACVALDADATLWAEPRAAVLLRIMVGSPASSESTQLPTIFIEDLACLATLDLPAGYRAVHVGLEMRVLEGIARRAGASAFGLADRVQSLCGAQLTDGTVAELAEILAMAPPSATSSMFLRQLALAIGSRLVEHHVGVDLSAPARGGLAHWQIRKAQEAMIGGIRKPPSMTQVATDCGLSVSHFTRAFRQTVGVAPRAWLSAQRIERAKSLMSDTRMALVAIALECGFADQSHFTRVFARSAGVSPGAWRQRIGQSGTTALRPS